MGDFHRLPGQAPRQLMSEAGQVTLAPAAAGGESRPWRRGVAWLLFLGPFFFISYGAANWWAATQAVAGTIVFAWERQIPFVAWTIVPYWSIDLLYGLSFLLCRSRREVDTHAWRLLTAQIVCVTCFFLFPLHFSFERPATDGLFGTMFAVLAGFDQPFNQAPSLHIALLVVIWARFVAASRGFWRFATHFWASLIAISVLTTYQHHFIDVPTGALVGLLCLWWWPDGEPAMLANWRLSRSPRRRWLAGAYLAAALLCVVAATAGDTALWLLWPAVALLLVSLSYLALGPDGLQKRDGRHSLASRCLLAPYTAAAWINSRLWTWRQPAPVHVADDVWLGRLPGRRTMCSGRFAGLLDLTAELPTPLGRWTSINRPWLDLLPPSADELTAAADAIETLRQQGPVLVCCALGYSRSAAAVAAWLLRTQRAASVDQAIARIAACRPQMVLGAAQRAALQQLLDERRAVHG